MLVENEFTSYHLLGNLTIKQNDQILAILYSTDSYYLSEFKAINKYKDLVWDIQGAIDNNWTNKGISITAQATLYGIQEGKEIIIRQQTIK